MILATSIEFIKNLIQIDYDGLYFDFHSDYECQSISNFNEVLILTFKNLFNEQKLLHLKFIDVEITALEFFNTKEVVNLTIDNLYRGKFEFSGELKEFTEEGKGYFYLEFYEGQKLEFWAKGLSIESL